MRNILTIIKKELRRFFTDKRMLISLILPGVIIFVLYSVMGNFMFKETDPDDTYIYQAVVVNAPSELEELFKFDGKFSYEIASESREFYKEKIANSELDLYIVYPLNFYDDAMNFTPDGSNTGTSPEVKIYYNSVNDKSSEAYQIYTFALNGFKDQISEKFRVNNSDEEFNLASKSSITVEILSTLLPFLLIIFLFSGAMQISIEAIAGEKERGTIATILATPISRFELAFGKMMALSIVSLVSAFSSFIGLMASIPKLMNGMDLDLNVYTVADYSLLLLVIITTTILYVVLISLVSAYSKSVKEASSLSAGLMIVNMLIGITSMTGVANNGIGSSFIPLYNSLQSISSVLSQQTSIINITITLIVNVLLIGLGIFGLSKMFDSEKIMFQK
jgi:sodium transport system permease protein